MRGYSSRGGGAYPKWWCTGNCLYFLHLLSTYGNVSPLNQLIRYIRRFAAISDVPLNISSNPPMLVPAEGPLLQLNGGSIREAYRDLAHIIHERFCYNRRCLTQARRARLTGKARQAGTGLTRHASRASRACRAPLRHFATNRHE